LGYASQFDFLLNKYKSSGAAEPHYRKHTEERSHILTTGGEAVELSRKILEAKLSIG
jgi:hypothetical protein